MRYEGLITTSDRYGAFYLLASAFALAALALISLECLLKADLRQRALAYLYYREDDPLSHPVPSLVLIWSSLGSYLLLGSFLQWHGRYDDAILRVCGLAAIVHAVLQVVLFVRHEYLRPATPPSADSDISNWNEP